MLKFRNMSASFITRLRSHRGKLTDSAHEETFVGQHDCIISVVRPFSQMFGFVICQNVWTFPPHTIPSFRKDGRRSRLSSGSETVKEVNSYSQHVSSPTPVR